MKKLLMGIGAAAILLATASCSKTASVSNADKSFGDSISTAIGEYSGMNLNEIVAGLSPEQKERFKKEDILRGFKATIMCDSLSQGFVAGTQEAVQLNNTLLQLEMSGIYVDRAKVYEAYAKAFMADSINPEAAQTTNMMFRQLMMQANERMQLEMARREEAARKAQQAEAAEQAGKDEYIANLVANDKSYTLAPSGIAYKVTQEGEGPAVGEGGSAVVKYEGRLTDGTVFDKNEDGVQFATNQVVPGFGEALSMLKKGEKMTVVIPAVLAYGSREVGSIPANSTLIFDIEAVEVQPAQ
ncbi:MAG: FKBP-type peptidyl-prolyl cis-trans isomerase [Duncaniella sp.]|nr:FKBP-type peptidyl-prolyl cis-trans isomerase [Duncaniella sp.]